MLLSPSGHSALRKSGGFFKLITNLVAGETAVVGI